MPVVLKKILKVIGLAFVVILGVFVGYFIYLFGSYVRIDDNQILEVTNNSTLDEVSVGEEYTIVTQNIGFGAYTRDFTFFMDGGTKSWGASKESVIDCVNKAQSVVSSFNPDFILYQEVDINSTRSYSVDQRKQLNELNPNFSSVGAKNFNSPFLFYPFLEPHGFCNSEIVTYSRFNILSSLRRSLPISQSITKLLDLDRCYSVSRIQVAGGKELVIINAHLSAYGMDASVREGQMRMLFSQMKEEYDKGNYCICGADFNHDFPGDSSKVLNGTDDAGFGWAQPFPKEILDEYPGINRALNYDDPEYKPTCRNCDIPYQEGNFTIIVDGFLYTDNITVTSLKNIVTGFEYSDHNPVVMKFKLN